MWIDYEFVLQKLEGLFKVYLWALYIICCFHPPYHMRHPHGRRPVPIMDPVLILSLTSPDARGCVVATVEAREGWVGDAYLSEEARSGAANVARRDCKLLIRRRTDHSWRRALNGLQ